MFINHFGLITVRTTHQLNYLSMQTYILGIIAGIIFLLIAAIISNVIKFEGGSSPKDPGKRRRWFWGLLVACFVMFFLYNLFVVTHSIIPNLQSKFINTNIYASFLATAAYFIFGFIVSKIFATGKLGNWFPAKKLS